MELPSIVRASRVSSRGTGRGRPRSPVPRSASQADGGDAELMGMTIAEKILAAHAGVGRGRAPGDLCAQGRRHIWPPAGRAGEDRGSIRSGIPIAPTWSRTTSSRRRRPSRRPTPPRNCAVWSRSTGSSTSTSSAAAESSISSFPRTARWRRASSSRWVTRIRPPAASSMPASPTPTSICSTSSRSASSGSACRRASR